MPQLSGRQSFHSNEFVSAYLGSFTAGRKVAETSGPKKTKKLYHGTSSKNLTSIMKEGLDPRYAGTGADRGVPTNVPGYEKRVYFTTKPQTTGGYGDAKLEVEVPEDFPTKPLFSGFLGKYMTDQYTTEVIPPKYLKVLEAGQHAIKREDLDPAQLARLEKELRGLPPGQKGRGGDYMEGGTLRIYNPQEHDMDRHTDVLPPKVASAEPFANLYIQWFTKGALATQKRAAIKPHSPEYYEMMRRAIPQLDWANPNVAWNELFGNQKHLHDHWLTRVKALEQAKFDMHPEQAKGGPYHPMTVQDVLDLEDAQFKLLGKLREQKRQRNEKEIQAEQKRQQQEALKAEQEQIKMQAEQRMQMIQQPMAMNQQQPGQVPQPLSQQAAPSQQPKMANLEGALVGTGVGIAGGATVAAMITALQKLYLQNIKGYGPGDPRGEVDWGRNIGLGAALGATRGLRKGIRDDSLHFLSGGEAAQP